MAIFHNKENAVTYYNRCKFFILQRLMNGFTKTPLKKGGLNPYYKGKGVVSVRYALYFFYL